MAERTNPHANLIIGAQDEATPVFEKIKASSQSMAKGVDEAAKQAAKGTQQLGDEAEKSHKKMKGLADPSIPASQKFDGATSSMIRQVQRLNAELEAGGARNAAYFEKMASVKGADLSALAPYLADLKKAEAAQRVATTGLDNMGLSAKQTAAALRQVPMQFTDIVVSLQGGQSAMQVFLQQGGQLKDMFGGAGNAVRAMGGYVAGLVTPFTMAAAAIATFAVAYKQGSAEADGYRMALVMTGNAAGTTASQMQQMAGRISSVVGTQGAAAEALAQMAASGRVASQSLEYFSEVAIKFERTTGTAISETVKRFAELGASPVDASRKLNEETNYLTASIYEQIKALKDQGREADAAALAQNTYADALNNRSAQITQNLGAIEGAWKAIKDAAKSGWDAMLNVGRADSLGTQIDNMRAKIAQAKGQDKNRPFSMPWDTSLADLEQQLSYLTEQERVIRRGAEAQAQRTQAEKEAIAAADALQKTQASGLTNQQKMNKALEEYARHIEKLKATNPASALLSPDAIARGEKAIRDQFSDKGKGSAGPKAVNKDLADQARLIAELSGLTGSFAKDWDGLSAAYARGGMSMEQLVELQAALLAKQPAIKAAADEQAKAQQALAKANLDAAASREKYLTSLSTGLDKIQADITAQIEATERMGLSKEAIAELDAAKLEMLATDLELQAIKAMDRNLDQQTYDALKKQAAAYRELGIAKKGGAAKEAALEMEKANDEAAKKAQEDWQRTSDQINQSLTDALMRGFESGKDFAKNLRDTVVNMFKTMVLRPVVSAIVSPVAGAITGALGLSSAAQAGQGGASSGVSTALSGASLLGSVGGSLAAGAGWLTGATTLGGSLSAGMSLLGTGSLAGAGAGLGMLAGALGPIVAGISLLSSAFSRKLKDQGIEGTLGGEAGFEGQQYRFYKGGLFRSDKTTYSAIDPELARVLAGGFSAVQDQVTDFAEALSLPTDRIKGFTTDIKVSFKGLDDAGIQKALQDALATGSNELAQQVLGTLTTTTREVTETLAGGMGDWGDGTMQTVTRTIEETTYAASEYAREGENAIGTLTRLATSLDTVNTVWESLGHTVYDASLQGADAASKLADAFGGLEAFAQSMGAYFQNFYSDAEQKTAAARQVSRALGEVGIDLDVASIERMTRPAIRAFVESIGAQFGFESEQYVAAIQQANVLAGFTEALPSVLQATQAIDTAAQDAARAAEEARRAWQQITDSLLAEQDTLQAALLRAQGREGEALAREREIATRGMDDYQRALYDSNQALRDQISGIELAAEEMERMAEVSRTLASELPAVLDKFRTPEQRTQAQYSSIAGDLVGAGLSGADVGSLAGALESMSKDQIAQAAAAIYNMAGVTDDMRLALIRAASGLADLKDAAEAAAEAAREEVRRRREAAQGIVDGSRGGLDNLIKSLTEGALKASGGAIGRLSVTGAEYEQFQGFAQQLDGATKSLKELEKLNLGDEFQKYADQIGAIVRETETLLAGQLSTSRLLQGDAAGALSALGAVGEATGNNAEIARAAADNALRLYTQASADALAVSGIDGVLGTLGNVLNAPELWQPAAQAITQGIVQASGDVGFAVRDAVAGVAGVLARQGLTSVSGPGVAGIHAAQSGLALAGAGGWARGSWQMGADVVAYGQALDRLDGMLKTGKLSAQEHAGAIGALNTAMGSAADLLGDTAAQAERLAAAQQAVGDAGLQSIGYYFGWYGRESDRLAEAARQAGTALGQTTDAIGRLESASSVFGQSASAAASWEDYAGLSSVSKARLVADSAKTAAAAMTTADAERAAAALAKTGVFGNVRDAALYLDGVGQYDSKGFEDAFTRIGAALGRGQINERQYTVLFDTALEMYRTGTTAAAEASRNLASDFERLRDVMGDFADGLLIGDKTTLGASQTLAEIQRQYATAFGASAQGDTEAMGKYTELAGMLLDKDRYSTQAEYNAVFGRVYGDARELQAHGVNVLANQQNGVVSELRTMNASLNKRVEDLEKNLVAALAQIAKNTSDTNKGVRQQTVIIEEQGA